MVRRDTRSYNDRRTFLKLTGGAAAVGLTAGCLGGDDNGDDDTGDDDTDTGTGNGDDDDEMPSLTYAGAETGSTGIINLVMDDQNIPEENGLDLDIQYMQVPAAQDALYAQNVDVSFFPPISVARVNAQEGGNMRDIFPIVGSSHSVIVREGSGIESFEDLQDINLGSLGEGSQHYIALQIMANLEGLDWDEFEFTFGAPPAQFGFMQQGELDAVDILEPLSSRLVAQDEFEELFHFIDQTEEILGDPIPADEIAAWQDTIDEKGDAIKLLFDSLVDAGEYIRENTDEVFEEYREALGAETDQELEVMKERLPRLYITGFEEDLRRGSEALIDYSTEFDILDEAPDKDDIFITPDDL